MGMSIVAWIVLSHHRPSFSVSICRGGHEHQTTSPAAILRLDTPTWWCGVTMRPWHRQYNVSGAPGRGIIQQDDCRSRHPPVASRSQPAGGLAIGIDDGVCPTTWWL
jgi:hypothetical protein